MRGGANTETSIFIFPGGKTQSSLAFTDGSRSAYASGFYMVFFLSDLMASLAITHFDIDADHAGSRLLPYQSSICRESRKLQIIRPLINNQLDHAGSPAYPS